MFALLIVVVCAFLALLIIVKHNADIARLLNGTESRFGKKPSAALPSDPDKQVRA